MITLMMDKIKISKYSPDRKYSPKTQDPNTVVLDNKKASSLEGGHSKKIGGMWTLKHEISSPKFYEFLIKIYLKGDTALDLKNFYNHINMCLNIQSIRVLYTYWSRLTMVARGLGYYGTVFQAAHGVTQGDPLSPTIFNLLVDAVVIHWVTVMVKGAEERGERGQEGRHQAALLYGDDGMVVFLDPCWIQGALNTLFGLFDRVGLWTYVKKTFVMVCRPCKAAGNRT